jgi:opacity protein-like surface antigen
MIYSQSNFPLYSQTYSKVMMKKICFTIAIFWMKITACALPVDNPADAGLFATHQCKIRNTIFGYGFYGDYVFNRHMETVEGRNIDTTELYTNAAYLSLILRERVTLFSTLGVTRLSLNTSLGAFNAIDPHPLFEIESGSAFSYSLGAKAILFQFRTLSFGVGGKYFAAVPNIKRLYIASGAVSYPDEILQTRYSEWQINAGAACRFNEFFSPYAALKYSSSFWKLDNGRRFIIESNTNTFLYNMQNRRNWGYAIGLTFCPPATNKMAVTVEARFPDEKALHVIVQAGF